MSFEHVDDYPEIPVSVASTRTALKTGAWRSVRPILTERTAPCSAGCPAGIGIPTYLHDIAAGRLDAAFAAIEQRNPFPRITGRVCPHPCEDGCNLAAIGDDPVSIRALERWLGDATADLPHAEPAAATGERIAVVGAGPAGLSAAYYLRRSGHEVTVFDRRDRPGGMLRYGIPEYRLPARVVDEEVSRLEAMGIEFRCGVAVGGGPDLTELASRYAAVFAATGAWRPRSLGIAGESLLEPGLAFLESAKRGEATLPGRRCAVVGGGNTAMDVARVLRKLGADVTVLYRRTAAQLPAISEEYERAAGDGVVFRWLSRPRSIEKTAAGLALTVEKMRLGDPDASGRPRPEPTGETEVAVFDGVFSAAGEWPDASLLPATVRDDDGRVEATADGATAEAWLFAGGDLATGPATVIEAIVAGRSAARAIDVQLGFSDRWRLDESTEPVRPQDVNPAYAPHHPRAVELATPDPSPFAEDAATLGAPAALAEIERCFSCGHCNGCGTCFVFCPDGAITWEDGPVIDLEFCKGCGICVTECPGHAFILFNERELSHA